MIGHAALTLVLLHAAVAQTPVWAVVGQEDPWIYVEGSVAVLGDVDRDGVADIAAAVGVYGSTPADFCYQIWTMSGATGQRLQQICPSDHTWGVYDLTAMGDVDQDGYPDYAVDLLSQYYANSIVRVLSWRTGRVLWEVSGSAADGFGNSILGDIDLDGDGRGDLVVNIPRANNRNGEVHAYRHDGSLLYRVVGNTQDQIGAYSGNHRLGSVGDLDGDGGQDFVVAGVHNGVGWVAYVISGRTGLVIRRGTSVLSEFVGFLCVDGCGDIDGDGVPDFLAGGEWGRFGGIVIVFSGRNGSRIRTHVGQTALFAQVVRGGGVDLDNDAVPDYLISSPWDRVRVMSGRDGSEITAILDERRWGSGHFLVAVPPHPGSPFGHVALTDREYYLSQNSPRFVGRLRLVRASHPSVRMIGQGCGGSLGHVPQLGMLDRGASGLRLHLSQGGDGNGLLLLGISSTLWGGLPLPVRLDGLGFVGCSLYGSADAMLPIRLSPSGPNGGYAGVDLPWPLQIPGPPPGFKLVGQWIAFGSGANWPGAVSPALEWWH